MPLTKSPFHLAILYLPKYLGIKVEGSNPCLSNSKFSNHPFSQVSNRCLPTLTKSSSNKIFIIAQFSSGQGASAETIYTIYRGATNIGNSTNGFARLSSSTGGMATIAYLDSPSTTSSTTYQVYLRLNGSDTNTLNWNSCLGSITVMEISA